MNRYYESHYGGRYEGMETSDDGDWVRYEDVQELQRQLDEERARLDYLEANVAQYGRVMVLAEFEYTQALSLREALDIARGLDVPGSDT